MIHSVVTEDWIRMPLASALMNFCRHSASWNDSLCLAGGLPLRVNLMMCLFT